MVFYIDFFLSHAMLQAHSTADAISIHSQSNSLHRSSSCCSEYRHRFHHALRSCCGPDHKSNRRRFWYSWLLFTVSSYVMCVANVATEYRSETQLRGIILPDIGFDFAAMFTPQITTWSQWPDVSVGVAASLTMLWLIVDGPTHQKLSVFRRFLLMSSVMYWLRAICVVSTQLPNPFQTDDPKYHYEWTHNIAYEALLCLLRIKATNNDVFFSGHTVCITMCALTLDTYCTRKWLPWSFWTASVFTLYVIVATKFHYTIDVVIAFALSVVIWKLYHLAMSIEAVRNNYPVFKWVESDREAALYRISNATSPSGATSSKTVDRAVSGASQSSLSAPLMISYANASGYNLDSVPISSDIVELSEERPLSSALSACGKTPKSVSQTQSMTKSINLP